MWTHVCYCGQGASNQPNGKASAGYIVEGLLNYTDLFVRQHRVGKRVPSSNTTSICMVDNLDNVIISLGFCCLALTGVLWKVTLCEWRCKFPTRQKSLALWRLPLIESRTKNSCLSFLKDIALLRNLFKFYCRCEKAKDKTVPISL